uniref:ULP_PROTEASE domain-containing protein n=1 Tax=Heterorhabditis bacteriophora TaxID=37862 RepID=A0A1I7WD12_HETBA
MRNKNIYVPGVGFAVPPEHQVTRLADPEIVTLAESIRRRKKDRLACSFIKTEQTTNNECAKEEGADKRAEEMRRESEDHPRLPKLVIKLPRRSLDKVYEKRKKKKRKKKDDDSDWEVNDRSKRKKHKRIRQEKTNSSGYELRVIEREPEEEYKPPPIEEDKPDISMFSKKRRLIMQWQEGQENKARENGEPTVVSLKGTFVVSKADLFRDDCALWRVDNQGMIQKYPPRIDPATKNVSYKNSSTYSGWGEHLAAAYYRVAIRHVKQTRSEAEVEPEIPLSDLFPAMTSECNDSNGFVKGDDETPVDPEDHMTMLRDPLRLSLYTFTLAMVNHALTLEFFQSMKQKNDKYEETIDRYTQMFITESDYHEVQCQCCSMRPVDRLIQLYSMDSYDSESLQPIEKESCEKSPLPATVCLLVVTIHNLELIGTQHPEYSPERTVDMAKKSRSWINKYCGIFDAFGDAFKFARYRITGAATQPSIGMDRFNTFRSQRAANVGHLLRLVEVCIDWNHVGGLVRASSSMNSTFGVPSAISIEIGRRQAASIGDESYQCRVAFAPCLAQILAMSFDEDFGDDGAGGSAVPAESRTSSEDREQNDSSQSMSYSKQSEIKR